MDRDARGRNRRIAHNGYVRVYLGKNDPAADADGWAYEHRLIMEEHLGRPLLTTELVHHVDHDKAHNAIENLEIIDRAGHVREHLPRKGTGSETCRRGHPWKTNKSGRRRCLKCDWIADKERKNG